MSSQLETMESLIHVVKRLSVIKNNVLQRCIARDINVQDALQVHTTPLVHLLFTYFLLENENVWSEFHICCVGLISRDLLAK